MKKSMCHEEILVWNWAVKEPCTCLSKINISNASQINYRRWQTFQSNHSELIVCEKVNIFSIKVQFIDKPSSLNDTPMLHSYNHQTVATMQYTMKMIIKLARRFSNLFCNAMIGNRPMFLFTFSPFLSINYQKLCMK